MCRRLAPPQAVKVAVKMCSCNASATLDATAVSFFASTSSTCLTASGTSSAMATAPPPAASVGPACDARARPARRARAAPPARCAEARSARPAAPTRQPLPLCCRRPPAPARAAADAAAPLRRSPLAGRRLPWSLRRRCSPDILMVEAPLLSWPTERAEAPLLRALPARLTPRRSSRRPSSSIKLYRAWPMRSASGWSSGTAPRSTRCCRSSRALARRRRRLRSVPRARRCCDCSRRRPARGGSGLQLKDLCWACVGHTLDLISS